MNSAHWLHGSIVMFPAGDGEGGQPADEDVTTLWHILRLICSGRVTRVAQSRQFWNCENLFHDNNFTLNTDDMETKYFNNILKIDNDVLTLQHYWLIYLRYVSKLSNKINYNLTYFFYE